MVCSDFVELICIPKKKIVILLFSFVLDNLLCMEEVPVCAQKKKKRKEKVRCKKNKNTKQTHTHTRTQKKIKDIENVCMYVYI